MHPLISVVYVNYNTSSLLLNSVESLIQHCPTINKEFIVVDNASKQIEKDILERWRIENEDIKFNIIFSDDNLGFAKGNNLGALQANGEYLFFLNPDTLVLNDVLSIFIDFMEKSGAGVSAIGGNLFQADLKPNYTYGNFPSIYLELCNIGLGLSFLLGNYYKKKLAIGCTVENQQILEVPYVIGAAIFMPFSNFKLVNGFDENYFMYYEETDLFRRFNEMGLRAYLISEAKIIHFEGAAIGKSDPVNFNYRKFEVALKSKFYYYGKWMAKFLPLIRVLVILQIVVQYLKGKWGNDFMRLFLIYNKTKK
jgi:GT2 family glycosyltransferase